VSTPRIVVAGTLPPAGYDPLRKRYKIDLASDQPQQRDSLLARLPGAAAIITRTKTPVDRGMIELAGDSLAVVARFGVGYDNIDLDAARASGVRVTNTPDVLTPATAELAVTLMLATARRVAEADGLVRRGDWHGFGAEEFLGTSLVGATVGLVGFGRIGREVARLLRGFDARILFADSAVTSSVDGAERCELAQLLAIADFVSLHVPLLPGTRHLIDADALAKMKPGAILINASRGAVVDTPALIEALRSRHLAAAGLDVYEREPNVPAELRELPNTVLLPHIGSATRDTRSAMARLVADNVIAAIEGQDPPTAVV
jgi:glyoxylate reductase